MKTRITLAAALLVTASLAFAEEAKKKPASPPATADATLGGKKVTVKYNAPSKRGRDIMGALVPYGEVWRTGANAATTLVTETDLMIGSLHVPAGTYTLFTLPEEKQWTLIVNKQTGQWGTNYDQSKDLGRVKMNVRSVKTSVETFNIAVKPTAGKNGLLTLAWDKTEASVPLVSH